MDYRELLDKYPHEIYQDIIVRGEVIAKGVRDASGRLEAIRKVLPANPVVLDVGCHTGYFCLRLAELFSSGVFVGVEGDYHRAELAGALADANRLGNVVILNTLFDAEVAERWGNSCEAFSAVMLLNVLHHSRPAALGRIVQGVCDLAPHVIFETPHRDESAACGSAALRQELAGLELPGYQQQLICSTPTHTFGKRGDDRKMERPMYLFRADTWERRFARPHYCHSTPSKRSHVLRSTGDGFSLNNKHDWIPGVNVGSMVALNMVYPTKEWVMQAIGRALETHQGPLRDVNLWNLILASDGIHLIDYESRLESRMSPDEALSHLGVQFDRLKRRGALPRQVQNFRNWARYVVVSALRKYRGFRD